MFVEYGTPAEAKAAVRALNGHRLDKNHVFAVNLFSDFDKYTNVADEWQAPDPIPYKDPVGFSCVDLLRGTLNSHRLVMYAHGTDVSFCVSIWC